MSKATSTPTTRRQLVKIGAAGMLAPCIVVPVAASPATPSRAEPSELGRALLAALHDRQRVWQAAADVEASDLGDEPWASGLADAEARMDELIEQIKARPIRTLSGVLDYAIAASADCHALTDGTIETYAGGSDHLRDFVLATLAAGGLDPLAWLDTTDGRVVA